MKVNGKTIRLLDENWIHKPDGTPEQSNLQRPTSNVQRRTTVSVRCSELDVGSSTFTPGSVRGDYPLEVNETRSAS